MTERWEGILDMTAGKVGGRCRMVEKVERDREMMRKVGGGLGMMGMMEGG